MVEIRLTCDKCGAEHLFEPELTSMYESTSPEEIRCLSSPREVSVVENVYTKTKWHIHTRFDERFTLCPDCQKALMDQLNPLYDKKYEAERMAGRVQDRYFSKLARHHTIEFLPQGGYVSFRRDDDV